MGSIRTGGKVGRTDKERHIRTHPDYYFMKEDMLRHDAHRAHLRRTTHSNLYFVCALHTSLCLSRAARYACCIHSLRNDNYRFSRVHTANQVEMYIQFGAFTPILSSLLRKLLLLLLLSFHCALTHSLSRSLCSHTSSLPLPFVSVWYECSRQM